VDLIYLEPDQTTAFDTEYHRPVVLAAKLAKIAEALPLRPLSFLDIGGGNGAFADSILNALPDARVTVLDVAKNLLDANKPDQRKELLLCSVERMKDLLPGRKFDVITLNWVLHHFVGPTRSATWQNCVESLRACRELLVDDGVIVIAENLFDGPFGSNIPSHIIYAITRIQNKTFVRLARRFFNTAGTGVCFRSNRNWQKLIRSAGLSCELFYELPFNKKSMAKTLLLAMLGLIQQKQGHYLCRSD
jgi:2-polyprenyl-3-methyl-5-hydroxy-6-metoxy-1,4-benzoquinol methylase